MRTLLIFTCLALGGCTLDWPAHSRGDSLGSDPVPTGPTHRAGQPCLWCHGGEASTAPGFSVAGTIYRREGDPAGVPGALVALFDANGNEFDVTSNSVGNFFVWAGSGGDREGELKVAVVPVFPLRVQVTIDGQTKLMRSQIGRDGGCATCHLEPLAATTVGKVWVEDQ